MSLIKDRWRLDTREQKKQIYGKSGKMSYSILRKNDKKTRKGLNKY